MDAAAKPPGMDSRRPPQPDPPRHPTKCTLLPLPLPLPLPLLWPLQVQGAALPKNTPQCTAGLDGGSQAATMPSNGRNAVSW
ncbi:hypothetical protein B9Y72_06800 [Stenotrophomonas maltophilia]|nr:hypothetical protein B9Y68_06800 [Stenotrophomonas maltophilia]PJL21540.1 hypothetical protein B9Y72_06800 [Stenotrophomonas maltophilia]